MNDEVTNKQLEQAAGGTPSTYESGPYPLYSKGQTVYYQMYECTVTEVSSKKKGWVWKEYTYSIRVDRYHSFIDLGNHKPISDSEKRAIDDVWEHDLRLNLNNL